MGVNDDYGAQIDSYAESFLQSETACNTEYHSRNTQITVMINDRTTMKIKLSRWI